MRRTFHFAKMTLPHTLVLTLHLHNVRLQSYIRPLEILIWNLPVE